jgi:hypothetical protein
MALHFVKTAIQTSTDGHIYSEEAVESDETRKARKEAEESSRKPLFQQLADIKAKKDEEYDENKKKMFAPPKGLDEDEAE